MASFFNFGLFLLMKVERDYFQFLFTCSNLLAFQIDFENKGLNLENKWRLQNLKGKGLVSSLLRVAWKAFIYCVWRERNRRLFGNSTDASLHEHIKEIVRIKFAGLRGVTAMPSSRQLCINWGFLWYVKASSLAFSFFDYFLQIYLFGYLLIIDWLWKVRLILLHL